MLTYKNAMIYTESFRFERGCFSVENGRFANVLGEETADATDLGGRLVFPGLIDVHTHGNSGSDFCDGSYEGLKKACRYYAEKGVTSFAPTSLTVSYDELSRAFSVAKRVKEENAKGLAHIRGINMEGPFFSEKKKGAQNAANLRLPDFDAFLELYKTSGELIKIVDIAPELEGSVEFIEKASRLAAVSIAHTDCSYEDARAAIAAGASHMTHLFNAMPAINHRKPGPIIAALESENVFAEIIGDGHHIHPAVIRFAFRMFGAERMILVSDSLRCCGMPDGEFDLGGLKAQIVNGVAKLADGTLAGSMTNVYECMKNAVSFGISLEDALRAASYNPAKQLGCLDEVGSIANGKCADFIIADSSLEPEQIFIDGERI